MENIMSLTKEQKASLRAALEKRRAALIEELRRDAERVRAEPFGALAGEAPDVAEESVAALIADTDQAEFARDLAEYREIELAFGRLAIGSYGTCADCGIDINFERLRANPSVSRCAGCQARHEKTYRTSRGARL